jgi:hypothetical protein
MLAVLRPSDWELPLFVHVLGASLLLGTLTLAAGALVLARRGGDVAALTRFGQRAILYAVIPSFILMRVGAELIRTKEDLDPEPDWIGVGYMTSDLGLLLLIATAITATMAARRGGVGGLRTAATWLTLVALALYVVALWAMTAKPG